MKKELYRKIPKVDFMIEKKEFKDYLKKIDQKIVVGIIRKYLDGLRSEISRKKALKTLIKLFSTGWTQFILAI